MMKSTIECGRTQLEITLHSSRWGQRPSTEKFYLSYMIPQLLVILKWLKQGVRRKQFSGLHAIQEWCENCDDLQFE